MRFAQSATLAIQREGELLHGRECKCRQKHHTPAMRVCIVSDAQHMEDAYLLLSLEGYVATSCVRAQKRRICLLRRRPPGKSFFGGRIHAVVAPLATKNDIFYLRRSRHIKTRKVLFLLLLWGHISFLPKNSFLGCEK